MLRLIYLFKPNEIANSYPWDRYIFFFKGSCEVFFTFIQILIEHSVSKQWRPRSDDKLYGVWSGSALFLYVPQKGCWAYKG